MDINFKETAYITHIRDAHDHSLFVEFYFSGMTWKAHLENHGTIAISFDMETAVSAANAWLTRDYFPGQVITLESLERVSQVNIDAYNQELTQTAAYFGEEY